MTHRIEQVNKLIHREISGLLQRQVKDPRLGDFVAVTEVSTSPDLRYAKVFVSSMVDEEERKQILSALTGAAGFFRNELAKRLKLRRIPQLSFHWDDSISQRNHLLQLMDRDDADSRADQHEN